MIIDLYIGETKLDLFKDETIELNSSIAKTSDISANTTDYTKSFTVPASASNNNLFKHYYDATIDNTFDARTKIAGRIELDGLPFKFGKWRLESVKVKQGNPSSYTVNFWGNLVSLKDKFKDDELSVLDLSEFDHLYNSTNVKTGLTNSLFSGNMIYNLFAKKQYYYNGTSGDNTNTNILANIAWLGGALTGVKWNDLKPSLRVIEIIKAIEIKYNIVFSRDFFGRSEFTDLFMWLSADKSIQGIETEQLINWTSGDGADFGLSLVTDTWVNSNSTGNINRIFRYQVTITPTSSDVPYKLIVKNNGINIAVVECDGGELVTDFLHTPIGSGITPFSCQFFISTSNSIEYSAKILLRRNQNTVPTIFDRRSSASSVLLLDNFETSANLPKIKVLEFLKGLFQMFKLVVIADEYNNIYVNTLKDYYAEGNLYDVSKYVKRDMYDVERGKILNEISFKFQEPTTLLNSTFLKNNFIAYGDEEAKLTDEDGNLLDGEKFEIQVPFEQIVYERLPNLLDGALTNIMVGGIFDESINSVNPKAHLFYNIKQSVGTRTLAFRNDLGVKEQLSTFINIPSHSQVLVNPDFSLTFGKEASEWNGNITENTLYKNYYQDYIEAIFNIKRRTFRYKGILPLRILTKLQLNDVLQIDSDYYRIDNYNFNLLNGEIDLALINSFDNNLRSFTASRTVLNVDFRAQFQTVYVTNLENYSYVIDDPSWLKLENIGFNAEFEISQNSTGLQRFNECVITNTDTLQEVTITIIQEANSTTFDSSAIRFDNDFITWDNG